MAAQKQEVELLIKAGTEGLKSIGQLVKELEGLGEDTGEATEKLQGMASSLAALKDQQALVKQFADLKGETRQLAQQQDEAKERATALGKALAETENPTKAQRKEFEQARKASKAADDAWLSNQQQLNELRGSLNEAGISTKDLAGEQVRIKKEIAGVNQEADEMAGELRQVKESAEGTGQGTEKAAKGTKELGEEAEKSTGLLSKLGSGIKVVATAAAGLIAGVGASVATLTIFSKSQAAVADNLTNTSNAIGVNREALQVWQIAAERVGVSGDGVAKTLTSITERLGRLSATGSGRAAQVFDALNMDIREFEQLAPDQQLIKLAGAIETLPKGEQVAVLRTLGSDAEKLMPLLEDNAAGLRAIAEEASQAGAIYSEEELDKLNRANDVYNEINTKIQGLTRRIGAELAPVVGDATRRVMELFDQSEAGQKLVDMFKGLIQWGEDLATSLLSNTDAISAGFDTVWSTVKAGASGVVAAFRGIQTVVATFLTLVSAGFSNLMSAAQGLAFVLNKVGVVSDEAYNNIKAKAEAARATTADLANQTVEYGKKAWEAGKGVITAFEPAEKKLKDVEDQTRKSGDALLGLSDDAEKAGEQTENAADKARDLAKAYKDLGVTSQAELEKAADKARDAFQAISQSGQATKREVADAFKAYAQAIIDTGDKAKIKALEAEAANLGLRDALKEVQEQASDTGNTASDQADEITKSTAKAADETKRLADETKKAKEEAEEAREKFREALGAAFAKAISNAREQVTALSTAARNLFEMKIGGNAFVNEAESATEALERARQRTEELASARRRLMSNSLAAWFADTALAASEVEQQFWSQAVAMENLQEKIESGTFSMDQLNRMSDTAANRFDLLDDQRLNGLQGAIDAARQKLESLTATADNTLSSLQQRLADIRGDTEEAQRIQYETERQRLQEQLKLAQQAGADEAAADYQKSLDTLEEIYRIEQRNRAEAENAREKEAADRARDQQLAEMERQRAQRELSQPTTSQARTETVKTVNVNLGGSTVRVLAGDEDNLIKALERARSTAL
ncbi:hypothetical protein [Marinobacter shengliensis]|uniref:Bacteriophage tail tape measure N-terminal domain-containing protein n=1 Tax=Marinobacter shengliensis TaxID=1389223 RepID=A0ABV4WB41_9GAMM